MMKQLFMAASITLLPSVLHAHEIFVKTDTMSPAPGATLSFEVHSTHVAIAPEEMEDITTVNAYIMDGDTRNEARLSEAGTYIAGEVEVPTTAPGWLIVHREGQIWSVTADGWQRGGKTEYPDAQTSGKYEKFTKVMLNGSSLGPSEALGHELEILPLANPAELDAGDELPIEVRYNGAPVQATIQATFDGFSDRPNTWAYMTETGTGESGAPMAAVKTWSPGVWIVRAAFDGPGTDEYDRHVLRAILMFEVD